MKQVSPSSAVAEPRTPPSSPHTSSSAPAASPALPRTPVMKVQRSSHSHTQS